MIDLENRVDEMVRWLWEEEQELKQRGHHAPALYAVVRTILEHLGEKERAAR